MTATDFSLLRIYTENPHDGLYVVGRVYDGTINITGGGGGWQSVQIPLKHPKSVWRGATDVYTMEVPLIFDVLDQDGADIEARCRAFEKMYGALVDDSAGQPPLLVLNANGAIPNDVYNFPPLRWVIPEPPTWGEQLRNSNGRRVRQIITAKFMKYSAYDELSRSKSAQNARPANTTTARGGDTYNKIAARALKQYGGLRWGNRLAQLNGARDGAAKLQPGQLVKLPTASDIKVWEHSPRR